MHNKVQLPNTVPEASGRTLEMWRWVKQGPAHVKSVGCVIYRLDAVEAYEAERLHIAASVPDELAP